MSYNDWIITGTMENGKRFRPSDWCERLSASLASFLVDNRLRYAPGVQPCIIEGERCLVVARWLESADPAAFAFVMGFARDNQLQVRLDRRTGEREMQAY